MANKTAALFISASSTTEEAFKAYHEAAAEIGASITYADDEKDSGTQRADATEAIGKFVTKKYAALGITADVAEKVVALNMQTIPSALVAAASEANYKKFATSFENKKEGEYAEATTSITGKHSGATSSATVSYREQNKQLNSDYGVIVESEALSNWQVDVHTRMQNMVTELLTKK